MGLNVKNILILIFFIFISFSTKGNVRTLEIGSLYYQCKPYQDMDFDFEKLSQSNQVKAMICRTTLIGIVNTGYNLCQSLRWYYKGANNDSKKILRGLSSHKIKTLLYEPIIETEKYQGYKVEKDIKKFKLNSDIIIANRIDNELLDVKDKLFSRDIFMEN